MYSSYEIQEGPWRAFGAGGGIVYKHRGSIRAFFGPAAGDTFKNLFNELYYSPDGQDLSVEYGISPNPAREVIGRITRMF